MKKARGVVLAAGLAACGLALADGAAASGLFYVGAAKNALWRTVTTSTARLALDWPAGATHARLAVQSGPNGAITETMITDTSLDAVDYAFTLPAKTQDERVETLTITYLNADEATVTSATAKLGVVLGTANGATVPCLVKGAEDARWPRCVQKAVMPIPSDATNLRLDDAVVAATPDSPGWWQTFLPIGSHTLTLAVGGEDVTANLAIRSGGFLLYMR